MSNYVKAKNAFLKSDRQKAIFVSVYESTESRRNGNGVNSRERLTAILEMQEAFLNFRLSEVTLAKYHLTLSKDDMYRLIMLEKQITNREKENEHARRNDTTGPYHQRRLSRAVI